MKQAALSLHNIGLYYGAFKALDQISIDVAANECLAIIGPNGAGKSSLLDVLTGFYKPSAGDIRLDGLKINHMSQQKRCRLGLVRSFQQSRLFMDMTVLENLQCAAFMSYAKAWQRYAFWSSMARNQRVHEVALDIASKLGLQTVLEEKARVLSYASQRLLELGMVLATNAKVLLLDEPTAGLSKEETDVFLTQIYPYTQNRTVLMIEHDMSVVKRMADRVLVLWQGQVLACDTPEVIFADENVKKHYLGHLHQAQGQGVQAC